VEKKKPHRPQMSWIGIKTDSTIVATHIDSECWWRQTLFTINIR